MGQQVGPVRARSQAQQHRHGREGIGHTRRLFQNYGSDLSNWVVHVQLKSATFFVQGSNVCPVKVKHPRAFPKWEGGLYVNPEQKAFLGQGQCCVSPSRVTAVRPSAWLQLLDSILCPSPARGQDS